MVQTRPPFGLSLPCVVERVLDGDTIEVKVSSDSPYRWKVRLIDCWAPETRSTNKGEKARGLAAKLYAAKVLELHQGKLSLYIPLPEAADNILASLLTFDRLLGHIFLDPHTTLSETMVAAGHATRQKVEQTSE